jgi:hypothetical protein
MGCFLSHSTDSNGNQTATAIVEAGAVRPATPGRLVPTYNNVDCSATIRMDDVLPHPGMLPSGPSIASPECSWRHVSLSID